MVSSRSALALLAASSLLLGSPRRGETNPDNALDEVWNVQGTHSSLGAYTGNVEITDSGSGVTLQGTQSFASGKTETWSATGTRKGNEITFEGPSSVGFVHALDGDKADGAKGRHGTYTISEDGTRLMGVWKDDANGTSGRETATSVASSGGLLVLVDGNGKDVPRAKKTTDGVVVAADVRETDSAPRQLLPFKLEVKKAVANGQLVLDFPEAKLAVWADASATKSIKAGAPFDAKSETLYLEGLSPSTAGASETLKVRLQVGATVKDQDQGKVTVAQSAFLICGHGTSGTYELDSYMAAHKLDKRTSPTLVMGKTDAGKPVPWAVFELSTQRGASLALSTEGAVVAYDGHSNFGLGFAFGVTAAGFTSLHQFMLISDPQCAVNWVYLREEQGHPNLMFEESEYGDDSSTPEFSDPVAVPRTITGAQKSYNDMRTVRFPLEGGQGERLHLQRGQQRWQDTHDAIDGTRIVLKTGAPDMPAKRWSKLMLNSCYSGPYYYDSFGGRGTLFFTLDESSSPKTSAIFIEGCIEGKSNDQITSETNAEENIWDYHVFGN
jgi:hypothetical protein